MRLFIVLVAVLVTGNIALGQYPRFTNPGRDPRSAPTREFNPITTTLVVLVDSARAEPKKSMTDTIANLRAQIANEKDDAKRLKLEERLQKVIETAERTADLLIVGEGMIMRSDGRSHELGVTTLRANETFRKALKEIPAGSFVEAENPRKEPDGTYRGTKRLSLIGEPHWWPRSNQNATTTSPVVTAPSVVHPILSKTSPTKYKYHPALVDASELDTPEAVGLILPSVFTVRTKSGIGTGFVINETGIAITNRHVIDDVLTFEAEFEDGRKVRGHVIGVADHSQTDFVDLALVRLEGSNFKAAMLGASANLRLGSEIILVGASVGLECTVTKGIVSAHRDAAGVKHVQTDAAANPGNSGGPMIQQSGAVVGILTWHFRGAEGIQFAIGIDEAIARLPLVPIAESAPTLMP
jgi:serine protease Do